VRSYDDIRSDIAQAESTYDIATLERCIAELRAIGTAESLATAMCTQGTVHYCMSAYAAALESYRRANQMFEDLGQRDDAAIVESYLGNVHYSTGDHAIALEHYRRALHALESTGNAVATANVTGDIGNVYYSTGDYPQALEQYRRALRMQEDLDNDAGAAVVIGNMGNVYHHIGDHASAIDHFQRALRLHEQHGNRAGMAAAIGNLGLVYSDADDYPHAFEHYQRAIAMHRELGNRTQEARVTGHMITDLLATGAHDEASLLLDRQASMVMDDPRVRADHAANRAAIAAYHHDQDAARSFLEDALNTVVDAGIRSAAALYHLYLRDLARSRRDLDSYITHSEVHHRIANEIRGREATQKLAVLEAERRMESEWREREKKRALLYGALPESVVKRMLRGEDVSGDHIDQASVLFLDIVGFTSISDKIPPTQLISFLKTIFRTCDDVCSKHGLTKIKTIGDSYMAAAGVPEELPDHARKAAQCAVEMLSAVSMIELPVGPHPASYVRARIGLHCGPLVAGIVGDQRMQYDVWGDTVNVASRMESTGEPGRIHVSDTFAQHLTADTMTLLPRGVVDVKGKGAMHTYWLEST
jgi:adenylate cyclase